MKKSDIINATPTIKVIQLLNVNTVLTGSATIDRLKGEDIYENDSYAIDDNYD